MTPETHMGLDVGKYVRELDRVLSVRNQSLMGVTVPISANILCSSLPDIKCF